MISARFLFLLSLFFIDVHVRAESSHANKDSNCWGKSIPCAIHAKGRSQSISAPGFSMTIDKNSLAEQRDHHTVQLVDGRFLISMKSPIRLGTPYAEFKCEGSCSGIFLRTMTEVTVKALSGNWRVKRLGEAHEYRLDAGLQLTVSEVSEGGTALMEFPQSLAWLPTVKEWASLYVGEPRQFKKEVSDFRESWREAVESVSEVHAADAHRSIASHQKALDAVQARQKQIELEDQRLRDLFRKKNHFD